MAFEHQFLYERTAELVQLLDKSQS